jgi:hypothetical protein
MTECDLLESVRIAYLKYYIPWSPTEISQYTGPSAKAAFAHYTVSAVSNNKHVSCKECADLSDFHELQEAKQTIY